ncbi:metalloregulator ArsR/SmtB family transcription factor [Devosia beringensis]|uniref:metalloregulator ArsR/SmtB family transcription factor n=1 Tax=Devosia beringensis TaxID=2657486 RepID=UPI001E395978|nr:metalloregulator ArsR/SmtB family transcription factor [Devosia beringensis]
MGINTVFEALSHPVRRKVLGLLKSGPMSAGDLAAHFDISRPTLSVHFAKLKQAELVAVRRQGTSLIYHLNTSVLEQALADVISLKEQDQ